MKDQKIPKFASPSVLIIGGQKINEKIALLGNYLPHVDTVLIGGAIANTFLAAQGFDVGKSVYEAAKLEEVREIMESAEVLGKKIILPLDAIVSDIDDEDAITVDLPVEDIEADMKMFDIGRKTISLFLDTLNKARSIIWSGALGHHEKENFGQGTKAVLDYLRTNKTSNLYIVGRDTADLIKAKLGGPSFTQL